MADHQWIKTDKQESGMAAQGCSIPGQGNSDYPGVPVQTCPHTGQSAQSNSTCVPVANVDEQCVDNLINPGRDLGRWGPTNQCQSFTGDVLNQCFIGPQSVGNPTGVCGYNMQGCNAL